VRVGLDREYFIDLLVELAVAGEAPSSPCRRRRGHGARLYGVASATENRHRGHCRRAGVAAGPASADFEHVANLSLAARGGVTARLCAFDLPLADVREDSAEMLVLDDGCLGNLPQLVEGGVGQIKPAVADCQPAIGIIDNGDALASQLAGDLVRFQQKYDLIVLQGQAVGDRPLFAPSEDVGEVIVGRERPMKVLGMARFLAEAGVVIG